MFLMFVVTAPVTKGSEVASAFLSVVETPPPPYLKSRGVYVTYGDEGYKWYNLVEIDDEHVSEGMDELMRRTISFDDVEGLKVKMEVVVSMRDAIKLQMDLSRIIKSGDVWLTK